MIKRNWFISTLVIKNGERIISWRVFDCTSFFANRAEAVEFIIGEIAKDNDVDAKDIAITAFNRA